MARLLIVEDNHALATVLASAARDRGYTATVAGSAEEALTSLEANPLDVAVVDLLLPDAPGTQVLDRLALAGVPAIAMSGVFKGAALADEAVSKHRARAFFEKPFELPKLLEALDRACGVEPDLPEIVLEEDEEDAFLELEALTPVEGAALLGALVETPPAPTSPPVEREAEVPMEATPEEGGEEDAHAISLPFAERGKVWGRPAEEPRAPQVRGRRARTVKATGSLAEEQVPGLLNAFHESRFTGDVKLRQGNVLKALGFDQGRAVAAASNLASERFGRTCVRKGVLPEARLAEVAELARRDGLRTGEALVKLGVLTPERRKALLAEQVTDIVASTLGWREGQYEVAARSGPRPGAVPLSLSTGVLILEGVMRTAKLVSLREQLPRTRHLIPTADPPYALHDLPFSGGQALLLAYADGSKSVEDLLALSELSERDALATLHALQLLGLVEERKESSASRRISFGL